jgi:hypothetical protein
MLLRELLAWSCSSSCCVVEYNVMFTFLHTHKKKKKNCTCYVRLDVVTKWEVVTYGIRAGSTVTWDRYGFR